MTITRPLPRCIGSTLFLLLEQVFPSSDKFREEEEKRGFTKKGRRPKLQAEQGRAVARKIGIPKVATHGSSSDAIRILGSPAPRTLRF